MLKKHSQRNKKAAVRRKSVPPFLLSADSKGSVLFYVFIAIGLLAALTLAFVDSSREGAASQRAQQITEALYNQSNALRAAILECANLYPDGGGDLDGDGDIDTNDNLNAPYPLLPTDADNPGGAAANNEVRYLECPGAPSGQTEMFAGASGRFAPSPPNGFNAWLYDSDATGVYVQIYGDANDAAVDIGIDRFVARLDSCETTTSVVSNDIILSVYVMRASCP